MYKRGRVEWNEWYFKFFFIKFLKTVKIKG